MEVLLGITGKDFVLIASSKAATRGPTILKDTDDKQRDLTDTCLLTYSGEAGDAVQFSEYIQANTRLYSIQNDADLTPHAIASYVRGEMATSLRSQRPYHVNLLLGGVDPVTLRPSLYWIDYLAACAKVPYAAHGYAQYYCLSLLDKHHHSDINLERGIEILKMCNDQLKRRLPIDFKGLTVRVVTKQGIEEVKWEDDESDNVDDDDNVVPA